MLRKMFKILITSMMILSITTMISAVEIIPAPYVSIDPVLGTSLVTETLAGTELSVTGFVSWVNGYIFQTSPQTRTIEGLRTLELFVDGVLSYSNEWGGSNGLQPVELVTRSTAGFEFAVPWTVPVDAEVGDKYVLRVNAKFATSQGNYSDDDEEEVEIIAELVIYVVPMAAPNVAELILRYNEVNAKYGKGKDGGNYIQEVASHMGVLRNLETPHPTDFHRENKQHYNVTEDRYEGRSEYRVAVLDFLKTRPLIGMLIMPCDEYFNTYGEVTCP